MTEEKVRYPKSFIVNRDCIVSLKNTDDLIDVMDCELDAVIITSISKDTTWVREHYTVYKGYVGLEVKEDRIYSKRGPNDARMLTAELILNYADLPEPMVFKFTVDITRNDITLVSHSEPIITNDGRLFMLEGARIEEKG